MSGPLLSKKSFKLMFESDKLMFCSSAVTKLGQMGLGRRGKKRGEGERGRERTEGKKGDF